MHKFSGELGESGSTFRLVPPGAMHDAGPPSPLKIEEGSLAKNPGEMPVALLVAVTIFRIRSAGHCAQHAADVGRFAHVSTRHRRRGLRSNDGVKIRSVGKRAPENFSVT